jgi:hypothetical protein
VAFDLVEERVVPVVRIAVVDYGLVVDVRTAKPADALQDRKVSGAQITYREQAQTCRSEDGCHFLYPGLRLLSMWW